MQWMLVNNELERIQSWPILQHCPGICLYGLTKTAIVVSQDCRCLNRNSNLTTSSTEAKSNWSCASALPLLSALMMMITMT
jgi:hypothetical protein